MLNAFDYLLDTASLHPEKIAFSDKDTAVTFSELLQCTEMLGKAISDKAVSPKGFVAVFVGRRVESVIGMLACLSAGYTYVPVDESSPTDRILEILRQTKPLLALYSQNSRVDPSVFSGFCEMMSMDEAYGKYDPDVHRYLSARRKKVLDIDPAYVIFTSGSTGVPKGILVSHRSLIDFTDWMDTAASLTADDVLGNQAPFYFDLSVKDLYQTLKTGCSCHILERKLFMFPSLLVDRMNEKKITAVIWSTSAFRLVAECGILEKKSPVTLKKALLGGEALLAKHVNIWKKAVSGIKITNLYGPTEVTVDCTYYPIEREFENNEPIPIGKACENMEVFLLDENGREVPKGETGEICVRGAGVAIGYLGDFEKTKNSFVQNPLNDSYPDIIYKTGDLAYLDKDGNFVFVSRKDAQIKHLGYRIELQEVENAVASVDGVKECGCMFDSENDRIVCAFSSEIGKDLIAAGLKEKLPKYMIPDVWINMKEIPHTPNGKIDRKKIREQYELEKSR